MTTIVVLGGYGQTGTLICNLLLGMDDVHVIIAGPTTAKARGLARELASEFGKDRVSYRMADASNVPQLDDLFSSADLVVIASSTARFTDNILTSLIRAGIHGIDMQFSTQKRRILQRRERDILDAGITVITDAGFHPGLPGVLIRYSAPQFDTMTESLVFSLIRMNWRVLELSRATILEFADEFRDFSMDVWTNGTWTPGWQESKHIDFGDEFGTHTCYPMYLEELKPIVSSYRPDLAMAGFFITGFNWFVDYVVMPLGTLAMKWWPGAFRGPLASLMYWGLKKFSRPPFGCVMLAESRGLINGTVHTFRMRLEHQDGYFFTAASVAAVVYQNLHGLSVNPGVWYSAQIVDPEVCLRYLGKLGVAVRSSLRENNTLAV